MGLDPSPPPLLMTRSCHDVIVTNKMPLIIDGSWLIRCSFICHLLIHMSHNLFPRIVRHMNELIVRHEFVETNCETYEWASTNCGRIVRHMNDELWDIWMKRIVRHMNSWKRIVRHMNELHQQVMIQWVHLRKRVMSHISMSHVTHTDVTHMDVRHMSCHGQVISLA